MAGVRRHREWSAAVGLAVAGIVGCVTVILFKGKTAYEMRISDWCSDVCSSDLLVAGRGLSSGVFRPRRRPEPLLHRGCGPEARQVPQELRRPAQDGLSGRSAAARRRRSFMARPSPVSGTSAMAIRSEEHTSELQSLMRISYAVFCLKKKTTTRQTRKE